MPDILPPTAIVAGGGLAGLAAALALARAGVATTVLDAAPETGSSAPPRDDGRTTAILEPGVRFLMRLGAWARVAPGAAPLARLRIVSQDDAGHVEADVTFAARELGLPAFGHNVANAELKAALLAALANQPLAQIRHGAAVAGLELGEHAAVARCADGSEFHADLLVAADGRDSTARRLAGIDVVRRETGQTAIVTRFAHERPHHATSVELHRRGGPFTLVPLPGRRSSLVWVERSPDATRLLALDAPGFAHELGARSRPWLGEPYEIAPPKGHALVNLRARHLVARRCLLLGEAAHSVSPLGAQGYNLTLRDAEALHGLAARAVTEALDIGGSWLLDAYARQRTADIRARVWAVDALGRAVDTSFGPARLARALGLRAIGAVPAARRAVMRGLMEPVTSPL